MYCIKCGVELADGKKPCPLCGTIPYHPDIAETAATPTYPPFVRKEKKMNRRLAMILVTVFYLLCAGELMLCDLIISSAIGWSAYAVGGMLVFYVAVLFPLWFKTPNAAVFVPCTFAAIEGFLVFVNLFTEGDWFLSFAFPVAGILGLIVTAVVVLVKYLKKGIFFTLGGAVIALGAYVMLVEMFATITFEPVTFHMWSVYPASGALILGAALIAVGACRPLRNWFAKKFFI